MNFPLFNRTEFNKDKWDMAIGLQEVDHLKPSKHFLKLVRDNIRGKMTVQQVEKEIRYYYRNKKNIDKKEMECDLVASRIVELLEQDNFELSIRYYKYIHYFIFQDIYKFAGIFREHNISKYEHILNRDTVTYGHYRTLKDGLEETILLEGNKDYNNMTDSLLVDNITDFSTRIWKIHPFKEGNTRTTSLFTVKYLYSLGIQPNIYMYRNNSYYLRNAFVRSTYSNKNLDIEKDNRYLKKFYENLLLDKGNRLDNEELVVSKLFQ